MESAPLKNLSKGIIYFLIGYYNKSKECLKVEKFYQTHSHSLHFKITGLKWRMKTYKTF